MAELGGVVAEREIEVTPEMIEAGVDVLRGYGLSQNDAFDAVVLRHQAVGEQIGVGPLCRPTLPSSSSKAHADTHEPPSIRRLALLWSGADDARTGLLIPTMIARIGGVMLYKDAWRRSQEVQGRHAGVRQRPSHLTDAGPLTHGDGGNGAQLADRRRGHGHYG